MGWQFEKKNQADFNIFKINQPSALPLWVAKRSIKSTDSIYSRPPDHY